MTDFCRLKDDLKQLYNLFREIQPLSDIDPNSKVGKAIVEVVVREQIDNIRSRLDSGWYRDTCNERVGNNG